MVENRKNISVLVVDDEEVIRQLLERNMLSEGYDVRLASDGEMAWKMIQERNPDIIISDMKMPRMDGFGLLKKVKADYPSIGFIVMTAFGDNYSVREAMLLGANEYLAKPFKSIEVALIVEHTYWNMNAESKIGATLCHEKPN